jgi:hypothetical protein
MLLYEVITQGARRFLDPVFAFIRPSTKVLYQVVGFTESGTGRDLQKSITTAMHKPKTRS